MNQHNIDRIVGIHQKITRDEENISKELEDISKELKESYKPGTSVLLDLTNSTELKQRAHENLGLLVFTSEMKKLKEKIERAFKYPTYYKKFLGDAYLLFFLSTDKNYTSNTILDSCVSVMNEYWETKQKITCAIDHGCEIINWTERESPDESKLIDPVGIPIDRCFRISSHAAPGQLLVSKYFHKTLSKENQGQFIQIELAEHLKGLDDKEVHYYKPNEDQINDIINKSKSNGKFTDKEKPLAIKALLKLLYSKIEDIK